MIDFSSLNNYKENNRLEVKKAAGGLPQNVWQTYSAFANTDGGLILLGVEENEDKTLKICGLKNPDKLVSDFWNTINNSNKINLNILKDRHVAVVKIEDKSIIHIEVPRAERSDRPIYLNNDIWNAYRRNGEGDYKCSKENIKAMLRDGAGETQDTAVLEDTPFSAFDYETVRSYRNVMRLVRNGHVWENLDDDDFLMKLGAVGRGGDEKLHPTAAGLLMFGFEHEIVREFSGYFLDYREHYDAGLRWTDRITSSSGDWSGNLFDFYRKTYNKLTQNPNVKIPFKIENGFRVDDTPVHHALREALANCLINADYYGEGGVVIKNRADMISFENPGGLRIKLEEAVSGGVSSPRNSVLMKMFNLLDIGERAGSGIPSIFSVWASQGFESPRIIERFDGFDRLSLLLPMKKIPIKSTDKKVPIKNTDNTIRQKEAIIEFVRKNKIIKSNDLLDILNVKEERVKKLLQQLASEGLIVSEGGNRNRTYRLPY